MTLLQLEVTVTENKILDLKHAYNDLKQQAPSVTRYYQQETPKKRQSATRSDSPTPCETPATARTTAFDENAFTGR
jgi:hypothetical protein